MSTLHNRQLRPLLLISFLSGLGYGLVFPVAALYGERLGLSPGWITAIIALHPGARLLCGRWWGRLADRRGRRPALLAGLALQATGHLLFAVGGIAGGGINVAIAGLALGRLLTGLGGGETVAVQAAVADHTFPEDRAEGFGLYRAANGLGMLSGPILGGACGLLALSLPGLVAAICCAAGLCYVALAVPESRPAQPDPAGGQETGSQTGALPLPILATLCVSATALTLAESVVPLAIRHVMVPTLAIPWMFHAPMVDPDDAALLLTVGVILLWGLTTAVWDGALSARVVRRFGALPVARAGLLLWAIVFAATPPVYRLGLLPGAAAVALAAIPVSLVGVGLIGWISRQAGAAAQGRVSGAAQSALALGEFLGPLTAGSLYAIDYGLPWRAGAALLLTAAVIQAAWRPREATA